MFKRMFFFLPNTPKNIYIWNELKIFQCVRHDRISSNHLPVSRYTVSEYKKTFFFLEDTPKKVDEIHRAMFLRIHVYP